MHGNLILMDGENVVPVTKITLPDDFTEYQCGICCLPTLKTIEYMYKAAYKCIKQYTSVEEFAAAINETDFNLPYNIFAYAEENALCICADVYEKWITELLVAVGKIDDINPRVRPFDGLHKFGATIAPYSPNSHACIQLSHPLTDLTTYLSYIEIEKNGVITFSKNLKEGETGAGSILSYLSYNCEKLGITKLYPSTLSRDTGADVMGWFATDIYGPSGNTWIIRGTISPKASSGGEERQEVIQFGTYEEGRGNNLDVVVNGNSVNNHLIDTNIHVTQANKEIWNNKQDALQHYTESTNSVVIGDTDANATVTLKCGSTEVVLDEAALIKLNQLLNATFAYPENS